MYPAVSVKDLHKSFGRSGQRNPVLKGISFEVRHGEMVALIGASGSGKSTLLRHISGLTAADKSGLGMVEVLGRKVQTNGRIIKGRRSDRADTASIFQQFNLVSRLSVLTNVCAGLLGRISGFRGLFGLFSHEEKMTALEALNQVGMSDFAGQRASTLSGGQQQRVAIARALVQNAKVILADEPIASLDPASSKRVMDTLAQINDRGITVIVCLHQVAYATTYCPRTVALRNGEIVFDGPSDRLTPEFLKELYGDESDELLLDEQAQTNVHFLPGEKPKKQAMFG